MARTTKLALITTLDDARPSNPIFYPEGPVDPIYGIDLPPVADNTLPPVSGAPDNTLPLPPTFPDNSLPTDQHPSQLPTLPPVGSPSHPITLPPMPPIPDQGGDMVQLPIYLPPTDDHHPDFLPPGSIWPPLPPEVQFDLAVCLVWVVGVGYRFIVVHTVEPLEVAQPK